MKKRLNKKRLALVIVITVLIVALVITGICYGVNAFLQAKVQKDRRQELKTTAQQLADENAQIEQMTLPDGITQETFDTLKQSALSENPQDTIDAILEQNKIEAEDMEAIELSMDELEGEESSAGQARYFLKNIDQYDEAILEFYLKDPDRYSFVKAFNEKDDYQSAPQALTESLDSVPFLLQWDLRWGYLPYGDSTVYYAGCAPTCLSMVLSYLKQDPSITPAVIKTWSEDNGYYVSGAGTAHSLLSDIAGQYDVQVEGISVDEASVQQALEEGKVLILNMVPGTFTSVGHFIVAYGMEDGKLLIRDPNSITRTNTLWDLQDVLNETAAIWAYSKPE